MGGVGEKVNKRMNGSVKRWRRLPTWSPCRNLFAGFLRLCLEEYPKHPRKHPIGGLSSLRAVSLLRLPLLRKKNVFFSRGFS